MAALFKTKDIKKRARNISQLCKWSWKMRVTNILLLEQHLMPDHAHPTHPPPHKHTHQQKGHCLPNDFSPSHLQLTQPYFQFPSRQMHKFSYHTTAQKEKKKKSISPEMSHKPNSTVPILNKSKKSIQTQGITWMSWLQEPFY